MALGRRAAGIEFSLIAQPIAGQRRKSPLPVVAQDP
jgi:hypothetical protein